MDEVSILIKGTTSFSTASDFDALSPKSESTNADASLTTGSKAGINPLDFSVYSRYQFVAFIFSGLSKLRRATKASMMTDFPSQASRDREGRPEPFSTEYARPMAC
jgi:hypothetical protein